MGAHVLFFIFNEGRVLAAFRNHDRANGATGTYTFFRITICYSNDSGKTWQYLSTPASDPGSVNGAYYAPTFKGMTTQTGYFSHRQLGTIPASIYHGHAPAVLLA
jgi:hypothetical protein